MAYVSQEMKKGLAPGIKRVLNKYGMKGTLAVRDHMTLICNIKKGKLDVVNDYNGEGNFHYNINPYWAHEHFKGQSKAFFAELIDAMKGPEYFDDSDAMVDYFHTSHYISINTGDWRVPYEKV